MSDSFLRLLDGATYGIVITNSGSDVCEINSSAVVSGSSAEGISLISDSSYEVLKDSAGELRISAFSSSNLSKIKSLFNDSSIPPKLISSSVTSSSLTTISPIDSLTTDSFGSVFTSSKSIPSTSCSICEFSDEAVSATISLLKTSAGTSTDFVCVSRFSEVFWAGNSKSFCSIFSIALLLSATSGAGSSIIRFSSG